MGAADVIPFIPIEGVAIEDCVTMARHVGAEIWKRYQIPVYLYEAAATTPERRIPAKPAYAEPGGDLILPLVELASTWSEEIRAEAVTVSRSSTLRRHHGD